jgi:glycosyltransferase involved in cell wall biosynthesis
VPPGIGRSANVLILGTAEWDSPIATNQHYVTRELAQVANVHFVESLGLRRPQLTAADVTRMAGRLKRSVSGPSPVSRRPRPDRVEVVSPLVVPLHRAPTRRLNTALLRRATRDWLSRPGPRVLWTFTPVTYGLEAEADVVFYHCVDLLASFPGIDATAVDRGERALAAKAPVAIATSVAVRDHLKAVGFPRVELLPNVADVSVFAGARRPAADRRPAVIFAGNLSPYKLDVGLLEAVARAVRGRGELILAGPLAAGGGDFGPALARLQDLGAIYRGMLSLAELAELAGECTVGLIPYALNDYTRGVSPLKCYEYLASGLAVVSTPLPEIALLAESSPHVTAVHADQIPERVLAVLDRPTDAEVADRVAAASDNGWEGRGRVLRELLRAELERPPR